jgi:hypothetical protein
MSALVIAALLAAAAVVIVPWYVRRMERDAELYAVWQDRFFEKFDLILDNKDSPREVVEIAVLFGDCMRNSRLLSRLVWSIVSGGARYAAKPRGNVDFAKLPPKVAADLSLMIVAWLHAISHTAVLRGLLLRNLMFPIFKRLNGAEANLGDVDQAVARPFGETVISVAKPKAHRRLVPA